MELCGKSSFFNVSQRSSMLLNVHNFVMEIGIDIVKISEFAEKLSSGGESFLNQNFSSAELTNRDPVHLAGIFAAKEAVFKTGFLEKPDFKAVQILNKSNGTPKVFDANGKEIKELKVSITHTKEVVASVAIYIQD